MGNINIKSSDSISNLKILYSSNDNKLKQIRQKFYSQRRLEYLSEERNILDYLFKSQTILKDSGRIPKINLLKVENFLNQIKNDINEFELTNIKNSYENRVFDNVSNVNNIDYYKIYGYSKNDKVDINDLKQKFKKFAIQTHPDRNNGNNRNFNIINTGYKKIMDDIELKKEDKQFNILKNNSVDYLQNQNQNQNTNTKFNKDNFNLNNFNTIYSENKIENVNDNGYSDWITDNPYDSEEIKKNDKLGGNMGQFNRIFDSTVNVNNSEIQKYRDPQKLFMNNYNNCSELGVDKIDNYTGETKSIKFTDYKEAHTTSKLIDTNIKYKEYKNISDLESSRSNIKNFTEEELDYYNKKQKEEEIMENQRIEKQTNIDNRHFKNYEKLNKIMIQ
jgi:curved DNA-binding protein CbpA